MKLANGIQFNDGTNLEDFKSKVDLLSGASTEGSSNTDTSYVDNKVNEVKAEITDISNKIEELKTKVEGIIIPDVSKFITNDVTDVLGKEIADLSTKVSNIVIPDISRLAKTEDVDSKIANVVASLNQVIADLKAGVYNSVTSTTTATV